MINIKIILYSTNCPKCKILKAKLDEKKIEYEICTDQELMINKGFKSVPMLEMDGNVYDYLHAINIIKEIE